MSQDFQTGDFLVFQLEAGYGLLRLLGITEDNGQNIWHLTTYEDLFLDIESVETALENVAALTTVHRHLALTNRAFESTQVARIKNVPLSQDEASTLNDWQLAGAENISDRSVRLMLGLR